MESKKTNQTSVPESSQGNFILSGASISISNASNVHLGQTIIISSGGSSSKTARQGKQPSLTPELRELLKSTEVITATHRVVVAAQVGKRWRLLADELGKISEGELDILEDRYKSKGLEEITYQMLLHWTKLSGNEATVGVLGKSLWKCRIYAAVQDLRRCCEQKKSQGNDTS